MEKKMIKFDQLNIVWNNDETWLMTGNPHFGRLYNDTRLWVTDELVLGKIELSDEMKSILSKKLCMNYLVILSTNRLHNESDTSSILFNSLWLAKEGDGRYSLHNSEPLMSVNSNEEKFWDSILRIGVIIPCFQYAYEEHKESLDQLCSDDITEIVTEDNICEEDDNNDFHLIVGVKY